MATTSTLFFSGAVSGGPWACPHRDRRRAVGLGGTLVLLFRESFRAAVTLPHHNEIASYSFLPGGVGPAGSPCLDTAPN